MRLCSQDVEKLQSWTKGLGKVMKYSWFLLFLVVVNRLQRCLWVEGRGWPHSTSKASQQQILAEISPMNRLFTASGSRGTKLPYCFCCPSTFLALQHSRQTDSRLRKQLTDLSSVSNWFKQISHASWPIVSEWCDVISMEFLYVVYQSSFNYQLLFGKWAHAPSLNRQRNAWVCYCQSPPIK